ncbi:glycosyltransferase involved in cell wall biosynthesis [Murinocardiopsis flavida]|uniref:Glycosyltransferase involved in cell wall biosynthesis n=1 Tax=Murinocardiopsis flavida TaxID=645275 RepID=A0A2P8DMY5_9ACTN|nr:glycosyltransferase [Murinocardiopsis flavida]PSK98573.1 glycosyltransferase involved in cell wall biosynthesis [Murinocardiopsis flavida]
MKIALVAEHTAPLTAHKGEPTDGESVHIAALARHLARLGHKVAVYARRDTPDAPERTRMGRGVTVDHLPAGPERPLSGQEAVAHTGAFAEALAAALTEDVPDVVHAFGWDSGLAAMSAARGFPDGGAPPVVQTFHSLNAAEHRAGLPKQADRIRMESAVAGSADRIIVTAADQRFELARMGVPRSHVSVVPFGVDTEQFGPDGAVTAAPWRTRRDERTRIVTVAGLGRVDGVHALVQSMARVPGTELVVVGGPHPDDLAIDADARRLHLLAKEAKVEDRITLVGAMDRKELPKLLRSADLYVSASAYDPFGGAVLEAMSCGLPVVATATGPTTGSVLHGTTGLLLRSTRPDALARAMRGLTGDPTMRTAFSIAGVDRSQSRYGWERVAAETVQVYESALPGTAADPELVAEEAS